MEVQLTSFSPQVGILLHYSTLATMLWIGVTARNIYKQVTKKAPPCPSADHPPYPKQPLLRYPSTHMPGHLHHTGPGLPSGGLSKLVHRETWGPRTSQSAQVARVGAGHWGQGGVPEMGCRGAGVERCAGGWGHR